MTFWESLAVNLISLGTGGFFGYGFAELQQFYGKRRDKREAAAVIRLETEMNLLWLPHVRESKVWFRDDAFVAMKNKGFISYLPRPLPHLIARAYDALYHVNRLTEVARGGEPVPNLDCRINDLEQRLWAVSREIDMRFCGISRNFGSCNPEQGLDPS